MVNITYAITVCNELEEITKFSSGLENLTSEKLLNIGENFIKASFVDELTIIIILANDDFSKFENKALVVNFSKESRGYSILEIEEKSDSQIIEILKSIKSGLNSI
jgi:hypothetical protein